MKHVLIYFDADKRPSPFDILFAYDVGFDVVQTFSGVEKDEITSLVQDAMFPRGPKGAKYTTFFFGGSDLDLVETLAKKARKTTFPPFNMSIVVDPKGSHTTPSAIVAKVMEALSEQEEELAGKKAAVLGGSGKVGRVATRILASEGVEVLSFDVVEEVTQIATDIAEECGGDVRGIVAETPEEIVEAAHDCDVVISAGPAGVEILPEASLAELTSCKAAADVNAVPPTGLGGVEPSDDKEEKHAMVVIGALAVGNLRNKLEGKLLETAMESKGAFLNYVDAFEFAKELVGV